MSYSPYDDFDSYRPYDIIDGNYRVITSSMAANTELVNKTESEGWKLFQLVTMGTIVYYWFKKAE